MRLIFPVGTSALRRQIARRLVRVYTFVPSGRAFIRKTKCQTGSANLEPILLLSVIKK